MERQHSEGSLLQATVGAPSQQRVSPHQDIAACRASATAALLPAVREPGGTQWVVIASPLTHDNHGIRYVAIHAGLAAQVSRRAT